MNTPTNAAIRSSVAQVIATELAKLDGYDPEDLHGGLYDVRWGGGASPEPEGDAWNMDYLPKGERIARELERSEALERKHDEHMAEIGVPATAKFVRHTHPAPEAQAEVTPAAYCDPTDPRARLAFSWPGTAQLAWHTTPLYLHPQPSFSEKPSQNGDTPSASETPSADAMDAERWRALLSCARIRLLGNAGFAPDGESRKAHPEYRHFGAEFWTHHEAGNDPPEAAEVLIQFADAAIAAQRKEES